MSPPDPEDYGLQRLPRQYLYFCTSKASKTSTTAIISVEIAPKATSISKRVKDSSRLAYLQCVHASSLRQATSVCGAKVIAYVANLKLTSVCRGP